MFLLILETIGTQELILIAIVALIILGPRKLPQMAKTIGKTMAEFRSATNQFKETWEKEVALEEEVSTIKGELNSIVSDPASDVVVASSGGSAFAVTRSEIPTPEIRELSPEKAAELFKNQPVEKIAPTEEVIPDSEVSEETTPGGKNTWL